MRRRALAFTGGARMIHRSLEIMTQNSRSQTSNQYLITNRVGLCQLLRIVSLGVDGRWQLQEESGRLRYIGVILVKSYRVTHSFSRERRFNVGGVGPTQWVCWSCSTRLIHHVWATSKVNRSLSALPNCRSLLQSAMPPFTTIGFLLLLSWLRFGKIVISNPTHSRRLVFLYLRLYP